MSYLAQNKTAITRGLTTLQQHMEAIVNNGMQTIGSESLDFLIQGHEVLHQGQAHRHPEENDTLGYAVLHDGNIVKMVSHMGGAVQPWGEVEMTLAKISALYPTGWVVIVAADMANDWYRLDWEMDFLHYAADGVRLNWEDYFKPL